VPGFERDVLVTGIGPRNRGFDGDIVIVELADKKQWQAIEAAQFVSALAQPTTYPPAEPESESDEEEEEEEELEEITHQIEKIEVTEAVKSGAAAKEDLDLEEISDSDDEGEGGAPVEDEDTTDGEEEAKHTPAQNGATKGAEVVVIPLASALLGTASGLSATGLALPVAPSPAATAPTGAAPAPAAIGTATPSAPSAESVAGVQTLQTGGFSKCTILRPVGKVVYILEANHQTIYAGNLKSSRMVKKGEKELPILATDRWGFFVPLDRRCPKILVRLPRIQTEAQLLEVNAKLLWVAKINDWAIDSRVPTGEIVRKLGDAGSFEIQQDAICISNSVNRHAEFGADVLACVPKAKEWQIPKEEIASRRDLREECIFTCDPVTARDLDDALQCDPLPNGNFRVGVHIADVSFFVPEGTALDVEAQTRATSVYLPTKVIPMLPPFLSEVACSLNPGVDRLAFSVIWELSPEGRIVNEWFGRSIIRSCAKLNYDVAQMMIDHQKAPKPESQFAFEMVAKNLVSSTSKYSVQEIAQRVCQLHQMALHMRKRRFDSGSLSLGSTKLVFQLDVAGNPVSVGHYVQKDSNHLVEEFMLLANSAVARRIHEAYPDAALLRRHPPPLDTKLVEFLYTCKRLGVDVDASSSTALHKSLSALAASNPFLFQVVQFLATKPMQPAKYTWTDSTFAPTYYSHYALAFLHYTHFTSPIRRYADLVVHRQLRSALLGQPAPVSKEKLMTITSNCNQRKMGADKVSEQIDYLYLCQYVQASKQTITEEAIVLELHKDKNWFLVLLPTYDIDEQFFLEDLQANDTIWAEDSASVTFVWKAVADKPERKLTLSMLTKLKVLLKVHPTRRPLELRLALAE
jgi:VacB/RNase II family 3'-5' exoribonuclease